MEHANVSHGERWHLMNSGDSDGKCLCFMKNGYVVMVNVGVSQIMAVFPMGTVYV